MLSIQITNEYIFQTCRNSGTLIIMSLKYKQLKKQKVVNTQYLLMNQFTNCRQINVGKLCDPRRIINLNGLEVPNYDVTKKGGVIYWMRRDCRVQDNWAMIHAQYLAFKTQSPLYVVYCMPKSNLYATRRQYEFLIDGLISVSEECIQLDITFVMLDDCAEVVLIDWVRKHDICAVICDFSPLKREIKAIDNIFQNFPPDVYFAQVDAHNVVPCWLVSNQPIFDTFRDKINEQLQNYLKPFPIVVKHPHKSVVPVESSTNTYIDWYALITSRNIDQYIDTVKWTKAGYRPAMLRLASFIEFSLYMYNNRLENAFSINQSDLSPFFHFGFLSTQRVIYYLTFHILKTRGRYGSKGKLKKNVERFLENLLYRREYADNYCLFNANYNKFKILVEHNRYYFEHHTTVYLYSLEELEFSQTYDVLWNKTQNDLREHGKIYPTLRVYWAKKILEWSATPEEAFNRAIYLNQRYALDSNDPCEYVGCLYAMNGLLAAGQSKMYVTGKINDTEIRYEISSCKIQDYVCNYNSYKFDYIFKK